MCVFDSLLFINATYNGSLNRNYYYAYDRPIKELMSPPDAVQQTVQARDTIEIYPNPSTGIVSIHSCNTHILGVSVLNVLGVDVLDVGIQREPDFALDFSKLAFATYFLRIEAENGNILRKTVRE